MSIKAQIWVETIVYTLIFLVIMAAVLAFVKPSIDKQKDKAAIAQGEEIMRNIDLIIDEIRYYPGNSRPLEIKLTKGKLIIDGGDYKYPDSATGPEEIKGSVIFLLEKSNYKYGENWANISVGNIMAETIPRGNRYDLQLKLNYSGMDMTYGGANDKAHTYQPSSGIYRIEIANNNGVIDFK